MRFSGLFAVPAARALFILAVYAGLAFSAENHAAGLPYSPWGNQAADNRSSDDSANAGVMVKVEEFKRIQARDAERFVDSMGINVHMAYTSSPYGHYMEVNERLKSLGMRHFRDEINDTESPFVEELKKIGTFGYTLCGLIEGGNDYPPLGSRLEADAVVPMIQNVMPVIEAVEGPNEPDDGGFVCDGASYPMGAVDESIDLWNIVKGSSEISALPVVMMSEGTASDYKKLAAITPPPAYYATYGNMHAYQGGGVGDNQLTGKTGYIHYSRLLTGDNPLWTTEMGYHNNTNYLSDTEQQGVSQRASAIYLPIAYLSGFNHHVLQTFSYELVDESQDPPLASCTKATQSRCMGYGYYGLLNYDLTPKPAYIALKNLIAILQEPGVEDFDAGSLKIAFSGAPRRMEYTLLQKSTGEYYLAIWNDISVYQIAADGVPGKDSYPAEVPVKVTFSGPQSFTVYAPNDPSGVDPTDAYTISTTDRSITLKLPPEVLLIKIE